MTGLAVALPPHLADIVAAFDWAEGQEKLQLLLDYANKLPPLPEWLADRRDEMEPVPECMTPVFLYAEPAPDGRVTLHFDVPRESPTVRGYAEILREGLSGCTAAEIRAVPVDFYEGMGLQNVLTPQRLNGIEAMLRHVQRVAG